MTPEPRTLNRILLGLTGVALLGISAAVVFLAQPERPSAVVSLAETVASWGRNLAARTQWEPLGHSWLWVVVLVGCVLALVCAVLIVRAQFARPAEDLALGNRASPVASPELPGAVRMTPGLARDVLTAELDPNPDVQSLRVTGLQYRGQSTLTITVTSRRGSSPSRVADLTNEAVLRWQSLAGFPTPVLVRITAGSDDSRAA